MGCDIHLYREMQDDEGKWQLFDKIIWEQEKDYSYPETADYDSAYVSRNYGLFGFLSKGVRVDCDFALPLNYPKTVDTISPELSKVTDYWQDDAHSHNTCTQADLEEFVRLYSTDAGKLERVVRELPDAEDIEYLDSVVDTVKKDLLPRFIAMPASPDKCRFVYFFDN